MGSIAVFMIGVIALALPASAQEAAYSDGAIQAAIDVGARDKVRDIAPTCLVSPGMMSVFASDSSQNGAAQAFDVTGLSPLARGGDHRPPGAGAVHARAAARGRSDRRGAVG